MKIVGEGFMQQHSSYVAKGNHHPMMDGVEESQISDESLLLEYRATGDRQFFDRLVRRYEREIYTFLRRFLTDAQMAEDAFQATFLSVHLRAEQFEEGRRFRPWLYAIATNKAIDTQRRNKRHKLRSLDAGIHEQGEDRDSIASRWVGDLKDPHDEVVHLETRQRVQTALKELNVPTQQLLQMAVYQGMKYSDIGEALGIPVGTVKSRVHTAMKRLQEIWKRLYGESMEG